MSNNVPNGETAKTVEVILEAIKERYGLVPFIFKVLSRRPDIFIPHTELASNIFLETKALSPKFVELIALSAAIALKSEHCTEVHTKQAYQFGASISEIFETMLVSSFVALTSSEAVAFRKLVEFEKSIQKSK